MIRPSLGVRQCAVTSPGFCRWMTTEIESAVPIRYCQTGDNETCIACPAGQVMQSHRNNRQLLVACPGESCRGQSEFCLTACKAIKFEAKLVCASALMQTAGKHARVRSARARPAQCSLRTDGSYRYVFLIDPKTSPKPHLQRQRSGWLKTIYNGCTSANGHRSIVDMWK